MKSETLENIIYTAIGLSILTAIIGVYGLSIDGSETIAEITGINKDQVKTISFMFAVGGTVVALISPLARTVARAALVRE